MKRVLIILSLVLLAAVAITGCQKGANQASNQNNVSEATEIRVGYFPNITHSQAIVGLKKGFFKDTLGSEVSVATKTFNAGPEEIEALFADEIDIGYIGPNPAINGYIKSGGDALRIIAGATSGGAAFVVAKDSGIEKATDLDGKKLASPQLGNTQDVALRNYVADNGLKTKEAGGSVEIIEAKNPDILALFQKKELDGAWVPEPWAARLVKEGNGRLLVDERDLWPGGKFVTANVIVRKKFLDENPLLVKKWLEGHVQTTDWINQNKPQAKQILNSEIKVLTGKSLADDVLDTAFSRLEVTYDPVKSSLFKSANAAYKLGFIKSKDLKEIYDLSLLNGVLAK